MARNEIDVIFDIIQYLFYNIHTHIKYILNILCNPIKSIQLMYNDTWIWPFMHTHTKIIRIEILKVNTHTYVDVKSIKDRSIYMNKVINII